LPHRVAVMLNEAKTSSYEAEAETEAEAEAKNNYEKVPNND